MGSRGQVSGRVATEFGTTSANSGKRKKKKQIDETSKLKGNKK